MHGEWRTMTDQRDATHRSLNAIVKNRDGLLAELPCRKFEANVSRREANGTGQIAEASTRTF